MKTVPAIKLFGYSTIPHASQIYTGLYDLHKRRIIKIELKARSSIKSTFRVEPTDAIMASGIFFTIDNVTCFCDLLDSPEIVNILAQNVGNYFKRSYVQNHNSMKNIIPLGLNFEVYSESPNLLEISRILKLNWRWSSKLKQKLTTLADATGIGFLPRAHLFDIEAPTLSHSLYDVLFLARAWDPLEPGTSLTEAEKEDRHQINSSRAKLIRALKQELGTRFLGGFSNSSYAQREFSDIVITDQNITKKENYLKTVSNIPICIATTGLHGSIGWKFAEYVALGRAVVSEKTDIFVPHQFSEGNNYLSFSKEIDCLTKINNLLEDKNLCREIMNNNHKYYAEHLKPEKIALEIIHRAAVQ